MEKLWEGIHIKVKKKNIKVRAAISCVSCDVPAARKIGGFVGHRGRRSCTKYFKEFPHNKLEITRTIQVLSKVNGNHDHMLCMFGTLNNRKRLIQKVKEKKSRATLVPDIPYFMNYSTTMQYRLLL